MFHHVVGWHGCQPPRQQVGPVLRAVEVAHVLVVRVEHHAAPRPDLVGRQRHEHTTGAGVALHRGDDDAVGRFDQGLRDVVDRIDVAPRLVGRAVGRLDHVQVDAIRPEIGATEQHQHARRLGEREAQRRGEPLALRRAHRTVVEGEMQMADTALRVVADLAIARCMARCIARRIDRDRPFGQVRRLCREGQRRGQLEAALLVGAAHVTDPDRTVDAGAQHGLVPAADHPAGFMTLRERLCVGVEKMAWRVEQPVEHARCAVGGAHLAQDGFGVVALPVDAALGLRHQRAPATGRGVVGVPGRGRGDGDGLALVAETAHRRNHCARRGFGDLVAVQARLGGPAHRKGLGRPHRAGVHLGLRLQHGDAPFARAFRDRPVEGRRPAVADDARVHDQADGVAPDVLGNRTLQERRDDERGAMQRHRLDRHHVRNIELDRHLVAERREFEVQALREAVEAAGQEQDAHGRA